MVTSWSRTWYSSGLLYLFATTCSGNTLPLALRMAKLFAGDLAQKVIYDCLQFHGGYGFIEEYPICRTYRDMRLLPIGGGTSEVMKEIIWKWTEMGG